MNKITRKLSGLVLALGTIAGVGLVAAPAAQAVTISYHYDAECMRPGVYYVGAKYNPYHIRRVWYRDYNYSNAEKLAGKRNYSEYSHVEYTNIYCNWA